MPADRLFPVCVVLLVSCLLLGGGTRTGFLSDALIQLGAIPVLLMGLYRLPDLRSARQVQWGLLFCMAVVLLPVLQLIPLPPSLWIALPTGEAETEAFRLLGQDLPWMPLSASPNAT